MIGTVEATATATGLRIDAAAMRADRAFAIRRLA